MNRAASGPLFPWAAHNFSGVCETDDHMLTFSLTKADFAGYFEGVMTSGTRDRDGETLNYEAAKQDFKDWSESQHKATLGRSYGNVRESHDEHKVIGVLTAPLKFDDAKRCIYVQGRVVDPVAKDKLEAGAFGGLSIGGAFKTKDARGVYTPLVGEVSLCDRPSNPDSVLTVIKSDRSTKQFATGHTPPLLKSLAVRRGQTVDTWGNDLTKTVRSPGLKRRADYSLVPKIQEVPFLR